ncbi:MULTISPECIES: ABC transporter substrate-binding protein [Paenibacillus]|jgi:multiple sugar transport system substrate-binding protein|uniref:Extracellular solute-binding protein n=1 Tax=Paenibacillus baimaensis TaxID=2982185 RepID=A0ABT2UA16_9BACL|nr:MULTISPECIES: extracellular solute-binding protein [unclassified Paenibacillus]MCU6791440.1 extracellular solute-binding protein [Paenibacillus sp. WQ 127069]OMF15794.1 sugar ABC transporter substrate-binding protein [Paenibacillus sp. FSL H7-0331]
MKKALTLILSAALLVTASGCGATATPSAGADTTKKPDAATPAPAPAATTSKDPVKLRFSWWGGQARHDYTLKIIELYQQKNPNVKIEAEYAAFDDYWKKLAPQAAANDLPDIIQMDDAYISQFGGRGQLEDLRPYMEKGTIDKTNISPAYLKIGEYDGKQYQLTMGVNALGPVMDADLLKKIGAPVPAKDWTWDDMEALAKKFKENGKLFSDRVDYKTFFPYYLRSVDQRIYTADGTALGYTDDKPFIDFFKRYQRWYDAGYVLTLDKMAQKKLTPEDDEMVLGNAGASFAWSNQYIAWTAAAKRPTEIIAPPGNTGKKALFLKSSQGLSVTKNSKNKEEAIKFVNFFINDLEVHKIMKGERGVPINSKIQEALKPLLKPEETKVFEYVAWAAENSSPNDPPYPVGSVEVLKVLQDVGEQILYKKISVEDGAAKFRKEANAILAKNKK